jgi:hypothetical protein
MIRSTINRYGVHLLTHSTGVIFSYSLSNECHLEFFFPSVNQALSTFGVSTFDEVSQFELLAH